MGKCHLCSIPHRYGKVRLLQLWGVGKKTNSESGFCMRDRNGSLVGESGAGGGTAENVVYFYRHMNGYRNIL